MKPIARIGAVLCLLLAGVYSPPTTNQILVIGGPHG